MFPERSVQAKSAKSVFFQEVNDIDVYIEDTAYGYSKIFAVLLSRVFECDFKISKVFPLGGRLEVLEEHGKDDGHRPSLYIIDGDLYLLNGDHVESEKGLYKFPFYCVENILCDADAIVTVMDEEEPVKDFDQIEKEFNYRQWIDKNEDELFSLFLEYAVSKAVNPEEKTVAFKVTDLVSSNKGEVDTGKMQTRIEAIKKLSIERVGENEYDLTMRRVRSNFEEAKISKLDVVSGKDYLFPLLKTRAKSIVKTKISDLNLKMRLAKRCSLERMIDIKEYVMTKAS